MNSFIQSLFFTDPLRNALVQNETSIGSAHEIRFLFGNLLLSKRAAFAPTSCLKLLPSWYQLGTQQDSSEFGKYILFSLALFLTLLQQIPSR